MILLGAGSGARSCETLESTLQNMMCFPQKGMGPKVPTVIATLRHDGKTNSRGATKGHLYYPPCAPAARITLPLPPARHPPASLPPDPQPRHMIPHARQVH